MAALLGPLIGGLTGLLPRWIWLGLAALAISLGTGIAVAMIFHKGVASGSASVTSAVQTQTIKQLDTARRGKEAADARVRSSPYGDLVERLR